MELPYSTEVRPTFEDPPQKQFCYFCDTIFLKQVISLASFSQNQPTITSVLGRLFLCVVAVSLSIGAFAQDFSQEQTYEISLRGEPVGYCSVLALPRPDGEPGLLIETNRETSFQGPSGTNRVRTVTRTWLSATNDSDRVQITQFSAGRTHAITVTPKEDELLLEIANSGVFSTQSLKRPLSSVFVGDVLAYLPVMNTGLPEASLTTLCPSTLKLTTSPILDLGLSRQNLTGNEELVRELSLRDSTSQNSIFVADNGEVAGLRTSSGFELRGVAAVPVMPEAQAPNLATVFSLATATPVAKPRQVRFAQVRFENVDAAIFPSLEGQTVRQDGNDTVLEVTAITRRSTAAVSAKAGDFTKELASEAMLPVHDPLIAATAKKIVAEESTPLGAAKKIRAWVFRHLQTESRVGIARNAVEVLNSGEGMCRDASVLAATLCRSVGIPTKLVGGLICDGDAYRYHAWIEVRNGAHWIPLDPSVKSSAFDAMHIKLTEGTYGEAFNIPVVRATKVTVELVRY